VYVDIAAIEIYEKKCTEGKHYLISLNVKETVDIVATD
jgi:hypothetical protein